MLGIHSTNNSNNKKEKRKLTKEMLVNVKSPSAAIQHMKSLATNIRLNTPTATIEISTTKY